MISRQLGDNPEVGRQLLLVRVPRVVGLQPPQLHWNLAHLSSPQGPSPSGSVVKLEQKSCSTVANWIDTVVQPWDQPLCCFPVAAGDQSCYEGCLQNFQVPNVDSELNTPRSSFHPLCSPVRGEADPPCFHEDDLQ